MTIETALPENLSQVRSYDRHIPESRLLRAIQDGQVMVLKDDTQIQGILRWSLFWQTIPFLDLIYLDDSIHCRGHGTEMMARWETRMRQLGYSYVMTSTQEDETAWRFYEKLGYRKIGTFLPPDQDAPEQMYGKELGASA